jgi:hypothetical protein
LKNPLFVLKLIEIVKWAETETKKLICELYHFSNSSLLKENQELIFMAFYRLHIRNLSQQTTSPFLKSLELYLSSSTCTFLFTCEIPPLQTRDARRSIASYKTAVLHFHVSWSEVFPQSWLILNRQKSELESIFLNTTLKSVS